MSTQAAAAVTLLTSPDGLAWTSRSSGTTQTLRAAAWTGSRLVVVGERNLVTTSP